MRILTVTRDANLAVGLSLRVGDGVEIETVGGIADLDPDRHRRFDVALIALAAPSQCVLAAGVIREHLGEIPCVIVVPETLEELPAGVSVLTPPFDLDAAREELERAVDASLHTRSYRRPARLRSVEITEEPVAQRPQVERRTAAMRAGVATPAAAAPSPRSTTPPSPPEPVRSVRPSVDEPTAEAEADGGGEADAEPDVDASGRPRRPKSRRDRLDRGLVAASEIQRLVDEIPQLNDRHTIGDALVHEITDGLEGAAAVLWGPDGTGGYEALAWDGVPAAIEGRQVAGSQPLLRDALEQDAVFLPPEERRPGYFDGLPGLHGGTVIAALLRADGETHGVVVVSGGDFPREDLIWVCALADEHAMALAIAAHLELLRRRPAVDLRERWRGHRLP